MYSKKSKETLEIDPGIIPDNLDVTVTMDVAMPQDQIGQANLYNQLKQDFPKTWLAENVMKVNNWKELQEDKWNDMATDTAIGLFIQQSVPMMVQQYLQSMMPQPQQPQMPGGGMPENTSQTPAPQFSPQENASMPPVEPMPGAAGAGRPMTGEEMGMQEEGMPV